MSHSVMILIAAVLLISSAATTSAFNVTRMLEQYPEFSEFNGLLSKTGLAAEVNRRRTVTVLALSAGHVGGLSSKTEDVQKRILSNHVVLDYYDTTKLNKLKNGKAVLTTLYQASGTADDQQGFINVIHNKEGHIIFGSAEKGSQMNSQLEGVVVAQPYNISILSISSPIIANGIDGNWTPMPPMSAPSPDAASSPTDDAPASAESPEVTVTDADAPSSDDTSPNPAEAPADSPNSPADAADAQQKSAAVVSGVSLAWTVALASLVAASL
ncbi:Fasciclin-like arabinogalactan protein 14 [Sesamum angolense]|uniref:Fasciclin-like arabinogalactan protein 14 n=1 Tax=Sesamum angolense TaxID=2727404 RepID=A0AAE1W9I6_9LAMI|nr:Fasciclin-like arabinogalactan protein 14 [Sesamum angolense]